MHQIHALLRSMATYATDLVKQIFPHRIFLRLRYTWDKFLRRQAHQKMCQRIRHFIALCLGQILQ